MVNESNFYWFFLVYVALAYLVDGVFGKLWWWHIDKTLEEYEPEKGFSKEYFAEKYGIELTDNETSKSGFMFETLSKIIFWLYRVLLIGGLGGILGMILAENFGHNEIFVWPGMCLGAFIGGVTAFFFLFHKHNYRTDSTDIPEEIPDSPFRQSEISTAEVDNKICNISKAQCDCHFDDFSQSGERAPRETVGGHTS